MNFVVRVDFYIPQRHKNGDERDEETEAGNDSWNGLKKTPIDDGLNDQALIECGTGAVRAEHTDRALRVAPRYALGGEATPSCQQARHTVENGFQLRKFLGVQALPGAAAAPTSCNRRVVRLRRPPSNATLIASHSKMSANRHERDHCSPPRKRWRGDAEVVLQPNEVRQFHISCLCDFPGRAYCKLLTESQLGASMNHSRMK